MTDNQTADANATNTTNARPLMDAVAPEPRKAIKAVTTELDVSEQDLQAASHYRDEEGRLVGYIVRDYPEDRHGGTYERVTPVSFQDGHPVIRPWAPGHRPLYRRDKLVAHPDLSVAICCDERTADAVAGVVSSLVAVSFPGRGGSTEADWSALDGRIGQTIYIALNGWVAEQRYAREILDALIDRGHTPENIHIVDPPEEADEDWTVAGALSEIWTGQDVERWIAESRRTAVEDLGGPNDITREDTEEAIVQKFNSEFAIVKLGESLRIMEEEPDGLGGTRPAFWGKTTFEDYWGCKRVFDPEQRQVIKASTVWMRSEMATRYRGLAFDPNGEHNPRYYNLWKGWGVDPVKDAGSYALLDQHIWENVCGERDDLYNFLYDWWARIFQNPKNRPEVMITMRGRQGSGKSTMLQVTEALAGSQNAITLTKPEQLVGRFNAHLEGRIFALSEEAVFGASDRRVRSELKDRITSDRIAVERKGIDIQEVSSYLNLMAATNEAHAIPVEFDDRRNLVVDVGNGWRRYNDRFAAMWEEELKQGGLEALMYDLMTREVNHRFEKIPQTQARAEQQLETLDPVYKWLLEWLRGTYTLDAYLSTNAKNDVKAAARDWEHREVSIPAGEIKERCIEYFKEKGIKNTLDTTQIVKRLQEAGIPAGDKRKRIVQNVDPIRVIELPSRQAVISYLETWLGWSIPGLSDEEKDGNGTRTEV